MVMVLAQTRQSHATEVPAHQWNVCSNSQNICWGEAGPNRLDQQGKASAVIFMVLTSNPKPWAITLQEVCSDTYLRIRDELMVHGYTPDRIITHTGIANCGSYGNAMFTIGTVGEYRSEVLGDGRAIGCRVKGTYVGYFKFCVTHTLGSRQVSAAADFYYKSTDGMMHDHRLLGADLNEIPGELPYFYAFSRELDYRSPPANTHNTQRSTPKWKIDYLFIDPPSWRIPNRVCQAAWSDHCYLYGTFLI